MTELQDRFDVPIYYKYGNHESRYDRYVMKHAPELFGIPEIQLRKATQYGVSKINIDTDGRLVVTAIVRKILAEKPKEFDPRKYLGPARDELKKMIIRKNKEVLGSAGQAKFII